MTEKADQRNLILIMADGGKKRVEVPEGCKVTYGPVFPMKSGNKYASASDTEAALRIYKSQTNVIAVFRGVREFWEEGLKIERRVKNTNQDASTKKEFKKDGSLVADSKQKLEETFDTIEEAF